MSKWNNYNYNYILHKIKENTYKSKDDFIIELWAQVPMLDT